MWAAIRPLRRLYGAFLGPLRPILVDNGAVEEMPPVEHPAGPLDALRWVNGDGLALGQFGTRGSSYWPEHEDPNPAYAVFDARTGVVRSSFYFSELPAIGRRLRYPHFAETTVLPDGRIRTYFHFNVGVLWTEGESPRVLSGLSDPAPWISLARGGMSAEGRLLLLDHGLHAAGIICENFGRTPCPPRIPSEGDLATLFDLDSGQRLWTIAARDEVGARRIAPILSPDNRYGLLQVPARAGDRHARLALVSLTDGHVVQELPGYGAITAEFTDGGRTLRILDYSTVAIYAIDP